MDSNSRISRTSMTRTSSVIVPVQVDKQRQTMKVYPNKVWLKFNEDELEEEEIYKSPSPERRPVHPRQTNFLAWNSQIAKLVAQKQEEPSFNMSDISRVCLKSFSHLEHFSSITN